LKGRTQEQNRQKVHEAVYNLTSREKVHAWKEQLNACFDSNSGLEPQDLENSLRSAAQDEWITDKEFSEIAQHYRSLRNRKPR